MRCLLVARWGVGFVALLLALPVVRADDGAVSVATEYVTTKAFARRYADPADRLARGGGQTVDLPPTPPPGTGRVPAGETHHYGRIAAGARAVPFVLAMGTDLWGVLALGGPGGSY
ncbi:MAG: hypothetical protein ACC662_09770, partial [Planctomycetota bacterium]